MGVPGTSAASLTGDERKKLYVRIPAALYAVLEELRFAKSKVTGRRLSLRQLVEQLLEEAVLQERGP